MNAPAVRPMTADEHARMLDTMISSLGDLTYCFDRDGRLLFANRQLLSLWGRTLEESVGRRLDEIGYPPDQARRFEAELRQVAETGRRVVGDDDFAGADGVLRHYEYIFSPAFAADGTVDFVVGATRDISDRWEATHALQESAEGMRANIHALMQGQLEINRSTAALREVSRRAGMSEVATNVLHNVGNVLNSLNVSASLMAEALDRSSAGRMAGVVALLREHNDELGHYLTEDARGRHVPAMLEKLSADWNAQQDALRGELESLRGNVEHIKQIVAMQQAYARAVGNSETLSITDLIEEALAVKQTALEDEDVRVVREFGEIPPVEVEKHRVLQILINLLRNAKVACNEQGAADKCITVRAELVDGRLKLSVSDNGSGITNENLTRVFAHGFTTRRDGHGFGLHSGALAAAELGGSLTASSEGPGRGATFTLDLPLHPPKAPP